MSKRHGPAEIIAKQRQAKTDLGDGLSLGQVRQMLVISEQTLHRWCHRCGRL